MASSDTYDRYLRTPEAAKFLGLSPRTLEKHRSFGTGPLYRKLGGRIVYAPADLRAWAERGRRISTTEITRDSVPPARPKTAPKRKPKRRRVKKPSRKRGAR